MHTPCRGSFCGLLERILDDVHVLAAERINRPQAGPDVRGIGRPLEGHGEVPRPLLHDPLERVPPLVRDVWCEYAHSSSHHSRVSRQRHVLLTRVFGDRLLAELAEFLQG